MYHIALYVESGQSKCTKRTKKRTGHHSPDSQVVKLICVNKHTSPDAKGDIIAKGIQFHSQRTCCPQGSGGPSIQGISDNGCHNAGSGRIKISVQRKHHT